MFLIHGNEKERARQSLVDLLEDAILSIGLGLLLFVSGITWRFTYGYSILTSAFLLAGIKQKEMNMEEEQRILSRFKRTLGIFSNRGSEETLPYLWKTRFWGKFALYYQQLTRAKNEGSDIFKLAGGGNADK